MHGPSTLLVFLMPQHLLNLIGQTFSGAAAKRYTAEIARHHRIQASPGYRDAARWLLSVLEGAGLDATIESYAATLHERFWALGSFQEWSCREATLDWIKEDGSERLCDYRASAVSVIQRSVAADGEFDVIDVGAGRPQDYDGIDVTGKLVLSRAEVGETYREAVHKRGAAGILFDEINATVPGRNRTDLPDARQYASFWWGEENPTGWGFVLTPRQGDAVRAALAQGEQVTMRVHIDARLFDGDFENVIATIPGSGEGALLATAHLCHPQGFANDNASGAAALLETAITLHKLIAAGQLPQPRRTIIFLWIPEMTGTAAWLSRHESLIPDILAGVNLDMVGEDQARTGSVLLIDAPPAAMPSFAPALLSRLRDDLVRDALSYMQVKTPLALIRTQTIPFSGGTDHMITSDPTVGIPTPTLIQWPDRNYHTTADVMEMVDERSLWTAGVLAGGYLVWLADAERDEAIWLGWEMLHRYETDLMAFVADALARFAELSPMQQAQAWAQLNDDVAFRQDRMSAALESLLRLAPIENALLELVGDMNAFTDSALNQARRQVRPHTLPQLRTKPDEWQQRAAAMIPHRLYRGPVMEMGFPNTVLQLDEADQTAWTALYRQVPAWRLVRAFAEYWADGRRSLAEIARLVALETGHFAGPAIESYFNLLVKAGLMQISTTL